jgi:hypothetical protein
MLLKAVDLVVNLIYKKFKYQVVVVVVVVVVVIYSINFTASRVFGTLHNMKKYEGSLKVTYIYKVVV